MFYKQYISPLLMKMKPDERPSEVEHFADRSFYRAVIDGSLQYGQTLLQLPDEPWGLAYVLCGLGKKLWKLSGDDAAWWSSFPINEEPFNDFMRLLSAISACMTHTADTSIPFSGNAYKNEAFMDWLTLAAGPEAPPASILPQGLGHPVMEYEKLQNDDASLTWEQAMSLHELAMSLLKRVIRPPRYIGRMLDIPLRGRFTTSLAFWDIEAVCVVPHAEGMWVALRNSEGGHFAAAWWSARPESSERAPLTFPPALWLLMHPIFAAIWHDLCADSIVVQRPPDLMVTRAVGGTKPKTAKRPKQQRVTLPAVRYVGTWGGDEELAAIAYYTSVGHFYRRLPSGWEDRATDKRFLVRQEEASRRAEAAGRPSPPLGFTFVGEFIKGVRGQAPEQQKPPIVKCQALFSLNLFWATKDMPELRGDAE